MIGKQVCSVSIILCQITASDVEGFAATVLQLPMIFTKLLPVAWISSDYFESLLLPQRERRKRLEAIGWISGYTFGCCGRVHRSVLLWCSLKNFQPRLAALFPSLPLPAQVALLVDFLCSVLFAPFPYQGAWSHVITRGMRIQNLRHENISLAEQRIRQDFTFILSTTLLSSRRLSKDKS